MSAKDPNEQVAVMRRPCLMEDEGRHFLIMVTSREKAEEYIRNQKGQYFSPSDYYIMVPEKP